MADPRRVCGASCTPVVRNPQRAVDVQEATYDGCMDSYWAAVIWSLVPTVVVLGLFIFVMRSVLRMDRNERRAYAKIEAEERAKRGLTPAAGDADAR